MTGPDGGDLHASALTDRVRVGAVAWITFVAAAVSVLTVIQLDLRPEPIFDDQFTHEDAPAVFVTSRLPLELSIQLPARVKVLRLPVWIGPGRRPLEVRVVVRRPGQHGQAASTRVAETGLARLAVPPDADPQSPLLISITSDATTRETAPRVLWSRDAPRLPMEVRYGGNPLAAVAVLPDTGPLLIAEYPWPTRWLLWLWVIPGATVVVARRRLGRAAGWWLVSLALVSTLTSALLWQRDYSRRAAHMDADQYAESAEWMTRFITRPDERSRITQWFRQHPHAATELVPALLVPLTLVGVPVTLAYMLLSALASWLALLWVQRIATSGLGISSSVGWLITAAFACHPLMLRTFARPVSDAAGLALVLLTLWLLLRRIERLRSRDELFLSLLILAHPLARPQGFGYWFFIAAAVVLCDIARAGRWPGFRVVVVAGLRLFTPPLFLIAALYLHFDWWHNVGLMLGKAQRFRLASTPADFIASCLGIVQLLPLLGLLGRRAGAPRWLRGTQIRLLMAWGIYSTLLLVFVRAPFWLRHFLPALPVVYWLAGRWLDELRGRRRAAGIALVVGGALANVALTIWQISHLEALPPWIAGLVRVP